MVFLGGARWVAVQWTPTFDGNQPITSFVIYHQNINLTSLVPLGTLQVSNLMFRDGNFMYNVTAGISLSQTTTLMSELAISWGVVMKANPHPQS